MFRFEDFVNEFSADAINHEEFLFNLLITALLTYILSLFYTRFGNTISNRKQFANNFMLLALTTMLIIYIVKSSIALSLGLVGALSIVRFRSAIKEPEELAFLFLCIGVGLGMGANQAIITILAFIVILALLFIQAMLKRKKRASTPDNMFINISTSKTDVKPITDILTSVFTLVELKRMDHIDNRLELSFIIETDSLDKITEAKDKLLDLSSELNFSFVEQRNLAV